MVRSASYTLIPPKLYKHFAAVTVALTALVAMAADNETRAEIDLVAEAKLADQSGRDFVQGQANRMADKAPLVGKMKVMGHNGAGFGPEPGFEGDSGGGTVGEGIELANAPYGAGGASGANSLPTVVPPGMAPNAPGRNKGRIGAPKRLSSAQVAQLMAVSASQTGGSDRGADLVP